MNICIRLLIILALALAISGSVQADELTNSGIHVGDWIGTTAPDDMTNETTGQVTRDVIGNQNLVNGSSGGDNTIINYGDVGRDIIGSRNGNISGGDYSSGGYNTIINYGNVVRYVYGSHNYGDYSSGGNNTIINYGDAGSNVFGSRNYGTNSRGGSNTISNAGTVDSIDGSFNVGNGSSGGFNTITNSGTVTFSIYGSYNSGNNSSSGSNTIINYGRVAGDGIFGSYNTGDNSSGGSNTIINYGRVDNYISGNSSYGYGAGSVSGGSNTIINYGTVAGQIYGSRNFGTSSSSGNTIINHGQVGGSIFGSRNLDAASSGGDDNIANYGTVGGNIEGGDGNDTATMHNGPENVGGNIDGGEDFDTIIYCGGTWTQNDPKVINFENFEVNAVHYLTLNGAWDIGTNTAQVNGGTLNVSDTLEAGGLAVNSGEANITGSAHVSGDTTVGGTLNVSGSLTTSGLQVSSGGSADISGNATVNGATTVGGSLHVGGSLNTGNLEITRGGLASISGTASVGGGTSVGGTLNLNGQLTSPTVTVHDSGMLYGNGEITGDLFVLGGVAPGNSIGTLTINGDASFGPDATYYAEIDSEGNGDLLSVSGTVSLDGATLSTYLPQALYYNGFSWTVIQTDGGISGDFARIDGQPDSQTLSLGTMNNGETLTLQIIRTSFADFACTAGGKAAGKGLDAMVYQARQNDDDMAHLMETMDWTYSADEIGQVVEALNPEMYTAFSHAALATATLFGDAASERMAQIRQNKALGMPQGAQSNQVMLAMAGSGLDSLPAEAPAPSGWQVWTRFFGGRGHHEGSGGFLGFHQDIGGVAAGADGPLSDWLRLGFWAGASSSDLGWDGVSHDGNQDGVHSGLYAQTQMGDSFLNLMLAYSRLNNQARRSVEFSDYTATAKSNFDSQVLQSRLELGHRLGGQRWHLTPSGSVRYLHLDEDGFRESGADFLGLGVDGRDWESLATTLGLRTAVLFELGDQRTLVPHLGLSWLREFNNDASRLSAHFRDYGANPFSVTGQAPAPDRALLQAGMELKAFEFLSVNLDYALDWGENSNVQAVSMMINIAY